MKKIYGILGAAALMTLASCSNDLVDAPKGPEALKGDLYLSMNLRPASKTGSRTKTTEQGSEIGKDYENKVSSAIIIFSKDEKVFYQSLVGETDFKVENNTDYKATFAVDRKTILEDIGDEEKMAYQIFVIANPTYDLIQQYQVGKPMQQTIKLEADGDKYWSQYHFLMSNAEDRTVEIEKAQIAPGKCTKEDEAYNLGTVKIQRAMSRFDIHNDADDLKFTIGEDNDDYKVELTFDGIAMVNQASEQYVFKAVSTKEANSDGVVTDEMTKEYNDYIANPTIKFGDETYYNHVFTPVQSGFTLPLFGTGDEYYKSLGTATDGKLTATAYDFSKLTYTTLASIDEEDNEYEGVEGNDDYFIWRYCMENTIYNKDNQVHGNSTGIVFRAKLTGPMIDGAEDGPVYAYNNVILGNAEQLKDYATGTEPTNDPGVYEIVKILYHDANEKYKAENDDEDVTDLEDLDKYLVENNFTIYRPDTDGNYYCYYTYWNRHNDNSQNAIMWPMEFATVRNNVYKISLNTVIRLGHPNTPDDDPDPEDPGTPDEKDSFYCTVLCKVLPWEVRINYVDF